jgi:hypothetical protein
VYFGAVFFLNDRVAGEWMVYSEPEKKKRRKKGDSGEASGAESSAVSVKLL